MQTLDFDSFATNYCATQDCTPEALRQRLNQQVERYQPDGWLMARCEDFCSSRLGQQVILPYGPNNSLKSIPDNRLINPFGATTFIIHSCTLSANLMEKCDG